MKKTVKPTALILTAALMAVMIVSCSGKKTTDKLTVIYPTAVAGVPAVAVAREKNYFKEEGLDVDFITLTSGTIEAISIGKADILLQGIIPTLSFAAQGADVRIIGGTQSGGNYFIAKKENAENLRDIKNWAGKRLGTIRLSTSEMVTRYALEDQGIDVRKDITYVEIDSYPNIIEGVRKGLADIGAVSAEYIQSAFDLGLEAIFPMTELSPNYVCCRETAYKKSLEANPRAYEKFHKAQIRAFKDIIEHPDEAVKIIAKISSQDEDRIYDMLFNPDMNGHRAFSPDPDLKRTRKVYETLQKWDYVENKGVTIEDIFVTAPYKNALDELIRENPNEGFYKTLLEDYNKNNT